MSKQRRSRKNKQNRAMVFNKRVFGSLMLIRSIDAREMKQYGISSINYNKSNDNDIFFVIASDGFWDVIDQNDIFDICKYLNLPMIIIRILFRKLFIMKLKIKSVVLLFKFFFGNIKNEVSYSYLYFFSLIY